MIFQYGNVDREFAFLVPKNHADGWLWLADWQCKEDDNVRRMCPVGDE